MISIISNSTQVFTDPISSGSMQVPLTSLVKKALAIITINGLVSSKIYAAAAGFADALRCAAQCLPYILDTGLCTMHSKMYGRCLVNLV